MFYVEVVIFFCIFTLTIKYTDSDNDGLQDRVDKWIGDIQYAYDENNNSIHLIYSLHKIKYTRVCGKVITIFFKVGLNTF